MSRKQLLYLIFIFGVVLTGRLWISGSGYMEDQDEFLYLWIHLNHLSFTHLQTWVDCVNRIQGQPPEIAIRLLEYLSLIPVASALHRQVLHPDVLYWIGVYNIITSLLISVVFYRILLKLKFSWQLAGAGVLLLATLVNSNIYTRHILPYEHGFLFQLLALNLLLSDKTTNRRILLAGLLSAIGLTNYLGYFMFVAINGGLIVFSNYQEPKRALKGIALFALPFVAVLLSYEMLARSCGSSYLRFVQGYSGTVYTEGSPEEGLSFIFTYFYLVERWWGVVMIGSFFAGAYLLTRVGGQLKTKHLISLAIIAYVTFGTYVLLFHKMNFEGRVLHMYFPFVVIGVLSLLRQQKLIAVNRISAAFIFLACINYCFTIRDLNSIGYPRNTIYKYGLYEDDSRRLTYYEDIPRAIKYSDRRGFGIDSTGKSSLKPGRYLLENICFLPTYADSLLAKYKRYVPITTDSLIYESPHFESYPAYAMEYCNRPRRAFFLHNKIKIRIYRQNAEEKP